MKGKPWEGHREIQDTLLPLSELQFIFFYKMGMLIPQEGHSTVLGTE